jgi:hypothetical protein
MQFSKVTLALSLVIFSSVTLAETKIAPANRLEAWIGTNAMPDSNYTIGTTSAMGTVRTLRANLLSQQNLASLDMSRYPGAYLDTTSFNGSLHQALSDYSNGGYPKQCVAFARSMTGSALATNWYTGTPISNYLIPSGTGYVLGNVSNFSPLQPGTMIAYFRGLSKYPSSGSPGHVAIFLSWEYLNGKVVAMNVVDQNLIPTVSINGINVSAIKPSGTIEGQADGMIQKHQLPLTCIAGSLCGTTKYTNPRYWAFNYHVVDVR